MSLLSKFLGRFKSRSDKANYEEMSPAGDKKSTDIPVGWSKRSIVPPKIVKPGAGFGFLESPWAAQFKLLWGNEQPPDYEKYITMYYRVPDIKRATDIKVNLSFGKKFTYDYSDDKKQRLLSDNEDKRIYSEKLRNLLLNKVREKSSEIKLPDWIIPMGYDFIHMGNAFVELCYDDLKFKETFAQYTTDGAYAQLIKAKEQEGTGYNPDDFKVWFETEDEINDRGKDKNMSYDDFINSEGSPYQETDKKPVNVAVTRGRINGIKTLDPRNMRTRRDPYGTMHGYIQLLAFPPVVFDTKQICMIRRGAKSWGIYNLYGSSDVQSLIRTQEMIWQIENDLAILTSNLVTQPGIFSGPKDMDLQNLPEFSEEKFNEQFENFANTEPGSKVSMYGNVDFTEFTQPGSAAGVSFKFLEYLETRRKVGLGVPASVFGAQENVGTQTTSTNAWNNFVVNRKFDQDCMSKFIMTQIFPIIIEQEAKFDKEFGAELLMLLDKLDVIYGGSIKEMDLFEIPLWVLPDMTFEEVGREDTDRLMQRAAMGFRNNLTTRSESRQEIGKDMEPDMEDGFAYELGISGESPEGAGFPGMGDPGKDTAGYVGDNTNWMSALIDEYKVKTKKCNH